MSRKPSGILSMGLALSVLGVVGFAFWLSRANDPDEAPSGPFNGRHVLVIGIDGCRPDALLAADAPHLKKLISDGVVTYHALAGGITGEPTLQDTVSGPGWTSINTGVWLNKHGVSNNEFIGARFSAYPHFFQRLKEREPAAYLSSIVSWHPIDDFIVEGVAAYTNFRAKGDGSNYALRDQSVTEKTIAHLGAANPDVVSIHFDQVDGAGHSTGFTPENPAYLQAIKNVDTMIGGILGAIKERPQAAKESWLVIVTTDHGGLGTSHGGQSTEERTIFMIVSGGNTSPRVLDETPGHTAVPPTVLAYLSLPIDPEWEWEDKPFGLPPYHPSGLKASVGVDESIVLKWDPAVDLRGTGLEILRNGSSIDTLPLGDSQFIDVLPEGFTALKLNYQIRVIEPEEEVPVLETSIEIPKPLSHNLRLHLPLDGEANDISGNEHFGNIIGEPLITAGAFSGQALTFEPSEESPSPRVTIEAHEDLQVDRFTDFTLSLWVRPLGSGTSVALSTKASGELSALGWRLALGQDGHFNWNLSDGVNAINLQTTQEPSGSLQWQHLMLVARRSGMATLYQNGTVAEAVSMPQLQSLDSGEPISLGGDTNLSATTKLSIDDFRFWTRALTENEMRHIYEQRAGPSKWRENEFTFAERFDTTIGGWLSDPDHDSILNLVEYASGTSPKEPQTEALLKINKRDQQVVLAFNQRRNGQGNPATQYHSSGVRYAVESTSTLTPPQWEAITGEVDLKDITYQDNGMQTIHWQVPVALSTETQRYYRIRYELLQESSGS